MPTRRAFILAAPLAVAGCGILPITTIDTAQARPGQFASGGLASDVPAVYLAQWAFADPARTAGRPADAARASAAMDYIAGALNTSPRWSNIPALIQLQLLQGRQEVRAVLGVRPGTSSQLVVDTLAAAADALAQGNRAAALRLLGPAVFTVPPETVLATLTNMPYVQMANVSTMHAANALFRPDDFDWR